MTYGHLQADCLYTGISSGPNARCRVWEAFTFTFYRTRSITVSLLRRYVRNGNRHHDTSANNNIGIMFSLLFTVSLLCICSGLFCLLLSVHLFNQFLLPRDAL